MEERRDQEFPEDAERSFDDRISEDHKYQQWLHSLKAKVGLPSTEMDRFGHSIYRVPRRGTQQQQENDPYTPRIASIGPLHRRKRDFLINEEDKFTWMLCLLERTRDPVEALQECANAIKNIEADARRCYETDLELKELEMVEILLLDGCFILESFISYSEDYDEEIPAGSLLRLFLDVQLDLALLENQIPFSVLERLFQIINDAKKDGELPYHLRWYALLCFRSALNISQELSTVPLDMLGDNEDIKHILDMLHTIYVTAPTKETAAAIQDDSEEESIIQIQKQGFQQTARGLHLAGIQLVKGDAKESLLGLYFHNENAILRIPCLLIDRRKFVIFKNLIAYEQLSRISSAVSSSAVLLGSLITSSHDVKLLKQKEIIARTSGETLDVLGFVQELASEASTFKYGRFQFVSLCERVNQHTQHLKITRSLRVKVGIWWLRSKDYWDRSISLLKLNYLDNFWTILSVVAAIILLVLTALQTVYTGLGYYHQ